MGERSSDPEKKYEPAFDAALERAGDRLEEIHREIESAAGLLEELAATPSPERPERIRTEVRFHALKLCDLLLKRSRESWFRDPSRAVELARMAVEIAGWLDAGYYGGPGRKITVREAKKAAGKPKWPSGKKVGHPGS